MDRFKYEVVGYGRFPIDMLRYDAAWPTSPEGASRIGTSLDTAHASDRMVLVIALAGIRAPTKDRWSTFGWTVRNVVVRHNFGTAKEREEYMTQYFQGTLVLRGQVV